VLITLPPLFPLLATLFAKWLGVVLLVLPHYKIIIQQEASVALLAEINAVPLVIPTAFAVSIAVLLVLRVALAQGYLTRNTGNFHYFPLP
jgi:hypothetical protein